MATTTTLKVLLQDILEDICGGLIPVIATATGGTRNSVVISGQAQIDRSAFAYDNIGIYVATDAGGANAAPEGEFAWVRRGGFLSSSGTWLINPAFTAAVASSDTIWFFYYGLDRITLVNAINRVLTSLETSRYLPLTLITDGDMEATGTTDFTSVGAPTVSKVTTAVGTLFGKRALSIAATAASLGSQTASVNVHENESLLVSVPLRETTGSNSFDVILYNVTASSAIKTVNVDQYGWTEVRFTENVPDNCEQVAIRIISNGGAATAQVPYIQLLSQDRRPYDLPSQVTDAAFFEKLLYLPVGASSESSDSYVAFAQEFREYPHTNILRDYEAVHAHRVIIERPSEPLFIQFRATYAELSANADTTNAPADVVLEGALAEIKRDLAQKKRLSPQLRAQWERESIGHAEAYEKMLERREISTPIVDWPPVKRVARV